MTAEMFVYFNLLLFSILLSPDLVPVVMLTDVLRGPEDHRLDDQLQLVEGQALQGLHAPPQRHLEMLCSQITIWTKSWQNASFHAVY